MYVYMYICMYIDPEPYDLNPILFKKNPYRNH